MGWTFRCDCSFTIKDLIEDLRRPERYAPHKLLRSMVVGNNHWYLMQLADGRKVVGLDLMKGPSRRYNEGAGYKDIGEEMGPCEVNCPLALIDNATYPINEYAYEWRKKVRAYHEAKKAKKKVIGPGTVVEYGGNKYRLDSPCGPRRGWNVTRLDQPYLDYRMKAHQIAAAKVIGEEANEQPATA